MALSVLPDNAGEEEEEPILWLLDPSQTNLLLTTEEAAFWLHRYVPDNQDEERPWAAVLVLSTISEENGVWVTCQSLGASIREEKKKVDASFRTQQHRIHICKDEP